jgi:hypothetical protein
MTSPSHSASPTAACGTDRRRTAVQAHGHLCGLDEVEVLPDGVSLRARLFGHVPETLAERHVRIEGGDRIRDVRVLSVDFETEADGDTLLHVVVDRRGDFSTYRLCLVGDDETAEATCGHDPLPPAPLSRRVPSGVDPLYACVGFTFRLDCPSQLDCGPHACDAEASQASPVIDYLARDFSGFRTLLLDRLAVTMPQWRERHVPDLGTTLVELLAFRADQLSYQLDAVATEAYLATARRRISVRRHARLVDYRLHEGCNARAWVTLESDNDVSLDLADLVLACPPAEHTSVASGLRDWQSLKQATGTTLFEPMPLEGTFVDATDVDAPADEPRTKQVIQIFKAHSMIHFYTWRLESCCLPQGGTRATLLDQLPGSGGERKRVLALVAGNYLILEETTGITTGATADADRTRRHVVRLSRVEQSVDPIDGTLLLEVEWDRRDALPFALRLSARTAPPACKTIESAVARGNVVLVDHGARVDEENDDWRVDVGGEFGCCECDGTVADMASRAAELRFALARPQVTAATTLPSGAAAARLCLQDPRLALPQVRLDLATHDPRDPQHTHWQGSYAWRPSWDLLSRDGNTPGFVAEVDDEGFAHIRFGDGVAGLRPRAGWRFRARYRVGNGQQGNVGADSIVWLAKRSGPLTGVVLSPRNPLPASGGIDPELVADARQFAPRAYGRLLERAVRAEDYAQIAEADARIDGARADLAWTGAWYEATVALDARAGAEGDADLADTTLKRLLGVRRIGHDLRIVPARRVPLQIDLDLCVSASHARADVLAAVLDVLSTRRLPGGTKGLFHADELQFGEDIPVSRLVAAVQRVPGVAHVEVTAFTRADVGPEPASRSLADGLIAIACDEIAQLDNHPDFPERGVLRVTARGGR